MVPVLAPIATVEPLTVKLPVTVRLLLTVVVPVLAPIATAVAAPAKLTVVAVVLTNANVVLGVVNSVVTAGVVNAGLVPKLVKLESTTVDFNVVPDNPPAFAVMTPPGLVAVILVPSTNTAPN